MRRVTLCESLTEEEEFARECCPTDKAQEAPVAERRGKCLGIRRYCEIVY